MTNKHLPNVIWENIRKLSSIFRLHFEIGLSTILFLLSASTPELFSQPKRILSLEQSIDVALNRSFDSARLEQSLINSRMSLKAAQSGLKSNGELVFSRAPNFQDNERQTEAVGGSFSFDRQRFLDFQADIFVNQPIEFTDGTLSLVGSLQRFQQFNTLGMSQLQAHAMSKQYEGMMQKANLRNYGRGGQVR